MDQFWNFAAHYWWLVFPFAGVIGGAVRGIARSLDSAGQRRHERRMEALRVKAAIRGVPVTPAASSSSPDSAPATVTPPVAEPATAAQLTALFAQHDDITHRWLDYELDVAKVIAYPAMSDGRQPLTAAFIRAKMAADALRPASAKAKVTPAQLAEYRAAVIDCEAAFELAERDARRLRDTQFSAPERKRLADARQLLTVAVDEAASTTERQLAYRRARQELDGLIALSDQAVQVLEKKVAGELPAAPTPLTSPPASPAP